MFEWFRRKREKRKKKQERESAEKKYDFKVLEETPWGVPVLDVQSYTQSVVSLSTDQECAKNAVSYNGLEGAEFAAMSVEDQVAPGELVLPVNPPWTDGVVRVPRSMEEKWAIYLHAGELLFVRSWTRTLAARAEVRFDRDAAVVGALRGNLVGEADPGYARRVLEYLVRDYGLGEGLPAPIPISLRGEPESIAAYAFSLFGNQARFVTDEDAQLQAPAEPLCAHSPLHLAVAQRDLAAMRAALGSGIPSTARGPDGMAALHWIVDDETEVTTVLLDHGDPVDLRSRLGTTPLMAAVQNDAPAHVELLLARGADADAADERGFTALHRAAEMGKLQLVDRLLAAGATRDVSAEGHTPLSLAELRGETEVAARLRDPHAS